MFLFNHCEYWSICQLFSHLTAKVTDLALSKSSQLISLCFTTSLGFAVAQTLESDAFPHNLLLVSPPIVRSPSRLTPLKVSSVVWGQVRGYSSGWQRQRMLRVLGINRLRLFKLLEHFWYHSARTCYQVFRSLLVTVLSSMIHQAESSIFDVRHFFMTNLKRYCINNTR